MIDDEKRLAVALAKAIAALCVRNTSLEELHSGITPSSQSGDYTDVKVVTPFGEIPWAKVSRISDAEMKRLMIEIVDKVYTFLCRQKEPELLQAFLRLGEVYTGWWEEPKLAEGFVLVSKPRTVAGRERVADSERMTPGCL